MIDRRQRGASGGLGVCYFLTWVVGTWVLALFSMTELLLFKIILVHMFACSYTCMGYSSAKKIENRNPAPSEGVAEGSTYGCVCRGAGVRFLISHVCDTARGAAEHLRSIGVSKAGPPAVPRPPAPPLKRTQEQRHSTAKAAHLGPQVQPERSLQAQAQRGQRDDWPLGRGSQRPPCWKRRGRPSLSFSPTR